MLGGGLARGRIGLVTLYNGELRQPPERHRAQRYRLAPWLLHKAASEKPLCARGSGRQSGWARRHRDGPPARRTRWPFSEPTLRSDPAGSPGVYATATAASNHRAQPCGRFSFHAASLKKSRCVAAGVAGPGNPSRSAATVKTCAFVG